MRNVKDVQTPEYRMWLCHLFQAQVLIPDTPTLAALMEYFVSRVDLCVIQISLLTAARKLGVRPELTETHQKQRQPHRVSPR